MTACTLNQEFLAMRLRFQRTLALSVAAHTLLILWLALGSTTGSTLTDVVEITWLEPTAAAWIVDVLEPTPPSQVVPERAATTTAPARPTLQDLATSRPNLDASLARLTPRTDVERALATAPVTSSTLLRATVATMAPVAAEGRPVSLTRGTDAASQPRALVRGPAATGAMVAEVADVPRRGSSAPNAAAAINASRVLDGVLLTGPAANRPVLAKRLPDYPEWAKQQAVEATVRLHFIVLPDGRIKENVQVTRTGGFPEFDRGAVDALRAWRFAPLTGAAVREQWGTITFVYQLWD